MIVVKILLKTAFSCLYLYLYGLQYRLMRVRANYFAYKTAIKKATLSSGLLTLTVLLMERENCRLQVD